MGDREHPAQLRARRRCKPREGQGARSAQALLQPPAEYHQKGSRAKGTSSPVGAAAASADTGLPARADSNRSEPPTAAAAGNGRAGPGQAAKPRCGRAEGLSQGPQLPRPAHPAQPTTAPPPHQTPFPRGGRRTPVTPNAVTCRPPAGPCAPHSGAHRPLIRPRLSPPQRPQPLPPRSFRSPPEGAGQSPCRRGG